MRKRWNVLGGAVLVGVLLGLLTAMSIGCGSGGNTSESSLAVTSGSGSGVGNSSGAGGDGCDLTPVDEKGTLRGCAAGTSTEAGPGLPFNFTGTLAEAVILTARETAAVVAANALTAARNPVGQDVLRASDVSFRELKFA
jgi:hypothetical protein